MKVYYVSVGEHHNVSLLSIDQSKIQELVTVFYSVLNNYTGS